MNFDYQPDDDSEEDEEIAKQAAAAQAKFGNMQAKAPGTKPEVRTIEFTLNRKKSSTQLTTSLTLKKCDSKQALSEKTVKSTK